MPRTRHIRHANTVPRGFTLVELLLYVGVTSIMVLTISSFATLMLEARVKNRTIAEVEQQGIQAMELITQTIRNAESVTAPTPGTNASTLTLDVLITTDDPTIFRLCDGTLCIDEGSTPTTVALTNSHVTVSAVTFTNLASASTSDSIRVQFTITYATNSNRNEFTYAHTFTGSATVR